MIMAGRCNAIIVLGLGFLTLACSRQQVFKPVGYQWPVRKGEIASWKHGVLPDGNLESHFEIFTDGVVRRNVGGRSIPSILVRLSVANRTNHELTLDGAQSHLMDNRGRLFQVGAVISNGAPGLFCRLRPQSHALIDLFYDVPRGVDPKSISSFTVHWRYTVDGQPFTQSAVFERGYAVD